MATNSSNIAHRKPVKNLQGGAGTAAFGAAVPAQHGTDDRLRAIGERCDVHRLLGGLGGMAWLKPRRPQS